MSAVYCLAKATPDGHGLYRSTLRPVCANVLVLLTKYECHIRAIYAGQCLQITPRDWLRASMGAASLPVKIG